MSKKSKMKEREEASYIAPCEDVVNELCKQCMRCEYCNEYHLMIGENYECIIDEDNL